MVKSRICGAGTLAPAPDGLTKRVKCFPQKGKVLPPLARGSAANAEFFEIEKFLTTSKRKAPDDRSQWALLFEWKK